MTGGVLNQRQLGRHNCVRFRFAGTGAIYKWEFQVDGRLVEYEVKGNLTISDTGEYRPCRRGTGHRAFSTVKVHGGRMNEERMGYVDETERN
jgi:hypothetical protein